MKGVSIKNLSLLGVVLMAASAVTAAVMPDKSDSKRAANGRLFVQSNDGAGGPAGINSCSAVSSGIVNCTATAGSATTSALDPSSSEIVGGLNRDTVGNTSAGTPNADSVLEAA